MPAGTTAAPKKRFSLSRATSAGRSRRAQQNTTSPAAGPWAELVSLENDYGAIQEEEHGIPMSVTTSNPYLEAPPVVPMRSLNRPMPASYTTNPRSPPGSPPGSPTGTPTTASSTSSSATYPRRTESVSPFSYTKRTSTTPVPDSPINPFSHTKRTSSSPIMTSSRQTIQTPPPLGKIIAASLPETFHLQDFISPSPNPALICPLNPQNPFTHASIRTFITHPHFTPYGLTRNDRIGILLPEGSHLALCLLTVMAQATAVPINEKEPDDAVVEEMVAMGAKAVVLLESRKEEEVVYRLQEKGIKVFLWRGDAVGGIVIRERVGEGMVRSLPGSVLMEWSGEGDFALVLRTSGTSGNKKTVPYTLRTLVIGALCVVKSWELQESDVNLNMMPLYHIGGIVRNLLAPLFSSGCVITCPGFDAQSFWDIVSSFPVHPTWYYGVPTFHHAIVAAGRDRFTPQAPKTHIRMICNAGGGLPDSLAEEVRAYFGCSVLPSYGMTECMPISTPAPGYKLERSGTSGRSCGPEIAIFNPALTRTEMTGTIGHICVRGEPLFGGYENNDAANKQSFNKDGWFDTGDLGYLDKEGFLFITGRSKEVINRGGEIISPMDVESSVLSHPRVANALAFSVPHAVFQETVGVVIVTKPGCPRPDIADLHAFLNGRAHPSKWPLVIVYMSDLPKNMNNKPLRINLAKRLGIREVTDGMSQEERIFDAKVPPRTASLQDKIDCKPVKKDRWSVVKELAKHDAVLEAVALPLPESGNTTSVAFVALWAGGVGEGELKEYLKGRVHDYDVPKEIVIIADGELPRREGRDVVDVEALWDIRQAKKAIREARSRDGLGVVEKAVGECFVATLDLDSNAAIGKESDFFEMGGDSLKAGRLVSQLRKKFSIAIPVMVVMKHRTVGDIAEYVKTQLPEDSKWLNDIGGMSDNDGDETLKDSRSISTGVDEIVIDGGDMKSSRSYKSYAKDPTRTMALFIQLLPMIIVKPFRIAFRWILFAQMLVWMKHYFPELDDNDKTGQQLIYLLVGLIFMHLCSIIILPLLAIATKWLVIGKYKAGEYPLWGSYYLRWWFVDQVLDIFGVGIFLWFDWSKILYLRLMGAKVGKNMRYIKTNFGEYDLINIGDDCTFDTVRVRPFAMKHGRMVLAPITIGENCTFNMKTTLASGANIPGETVLPPLSSTYDLPDPAMRLHQEYLQTNRNNHRNPHILLQIFFGHPVLLFVTLISILPWGYVMYQLSLHRFFVEDATPYPFGQILHYFGTPQRIAYHLLAVTVKAIIQPPLYVCCAIIAKWVFVGKLREVRAEDMTQMELLRRWILKGLVGDGRFKGAYELFGKHYEMTSYVYRMFGARIGKGVYWPGTPIDMWEFDLIEIRDHVVFGSRSTILCSDGEGSKGVRIEAGAMVADRCVLLPGTVVGRKAVLGSGGLCHREAVLEPGSIWIGSRDGKAVLWDEGDKREAMTGETESPFAKAFYGKKATFRVIPMWACVAYNFLIGAIVANYWTLPIVAGVQVGMRIYGPVPRSQRGWQWKSTLIAYAVIFAAVSLSFTFLSVLSLLIEIAAKWSIFGRRQVGKHNWDEDSYCQRWQIYLAVTRVRRDVLDFIRGSHYIVLFFRALGCNIGTNVCLYPTGGDPMMTEPDLVKIGNDACIDRASVVAHINSQGQFALNPLSIGRRCVLRAESRLLSGAEMEEGSILLEKTLVVSGEVVGRGNVWAGWPGEERGEVRVDWEGGVGKKGKKRGWKRVVKGVFGVFAVGRRRRRTTTETA
ncbi:hypothetical protein HDV00_008707 [Rhizophlyctis rosea]|nr:hypothetical protein HDV00_008707 [Rhizophlyctis rosea]